MAEFVRERHQRHGAQARLYVFFGRVFRPSREDLVELRFESRKRARDRNLQVFDAEIAGEGMRIVDAPTR